MIIDLEQMFYMVNGLTKGAGVRVAVHHTDYVWVDTSVFLYISTIVALYISSIVTLYISSIVTL